MNKQDEDIWTKEFRKVIFIWEDGKIVNVADMPFEAVKQNPEFMGFLFYKDLWDIQGQKQLFLDYCKKMIEMYPTFSGHMRCIPC